MSNQIEKVIVIGGGGNIGPFIIDELQNAGFEVAVLSRTSSSSVFPPNVVVHRTNYGEASLIEIFRGFDAVVSAVATFSTDQQKTIIDAAVHAGIKRFLPSEYGIDSSLSQFAEALSFESVKKQETVEYLKGKESTQMSWTALCVGAFFDWVLKVGGGLMGWDIPARKATIYDSGNQPYEATNVRQIGRAVAGILKHPKETENKYVYVNSFTLTQNQVLAAIERESGERFQVTRMTTTELRDEGYRNVEEGNLGLGFPQVVSSAIYGYGGLCRGGRDVPKPAVVERSWNYYVEASCQTQEHGMIFNEPESQIWSLEADLLEALSIAGVKAGNLWKSKRHEVFGRRDCTYQPKCT